MNRGPTITEKPPVRPALIHFDPGSSALRVAALPLLDRLLVQVHRAGFAPIHVEVPDDALLPPLRRARAWSIPFEVHRGPSQGTRNAGGPVFVARSDVLVHVADLRRLAESGEGRLVAADGTALPVGLVAAGGETTVSALESARAIRAEGVAWSVRNRDDARRAEAALWRSLTSSSDGWVDRVFNRPVGRPLAKLLIWTPITPNMISVGATLLGVLAAAMFALGSPGWAIVAALIFQVSAIVDCVDGDVARSVYKETALGKWLDIVGDQVVHLGVFAGIAAGLWREGAGGHVGWLGVSAMAGAAISFLVVMRGMRQASARGGAGDGTLQRLLDAATNRDFSVLVLALACVGRLEVFLWMAAIGSHAFWLLLLVLQFRQPGSQEGAG